MAAHDTQRDPAEPVAAIDIGSNSLRMAIAQVTPEGQVEVLERARQPVRLGHDTFLTGRLSPRTVEAAIAVLRDYRRVLDTYGIGTVRAVATSAVREAANREAFLDRIARTTGFDVEVIETTEQSRLIVAAVRDALGDALDLSRRTSMIAEVGGGSTLLTVLKKGEITVSQSFNAGSIRIQETLATAQEPPARAAELIRQQVGATAALARKSLGLSKVRSFVAIGGDARFAADQVGDPLDAGDLRAVSQNALDGLLEGCALLSAEQIARIYRMPFADAETLVPALLVYQALLDATRADGMIVSQVSMRDGLLLDLPRYLSGEQDPDLVENMIRSAKALGEKYEYDAEHAEHVAALAAQLFDELQSEHRLTPRHRVLLRLAAVLHDVGSFVSNRAHHKHTQYLVANSEIFGLPRDDLNLVAQVARYHRRSMPKPTHVEYASLPRERRLVVNKLAAILRVADALDRGHWQQARELQLERRGRNLIIYVSGGGDLTLERRSMAEKGDLFEEIFGMQVHVEEEGAGRPVLPGPELGEQ
jgi:exopolyphosphatase/guanosine-5'-triphosphate,3'-diphosphate pyrophosphatase